MLAFATEIPLSGDRSLQDFLALAARWLDGSPHSGVSLADIPGAKDGEIVEVEVGTHSIAIGLLQDHQTPMAGLRYTWVEDDARQWAAELVATASDSTHMASVRVHCESLIATPDLPRARKPYFVKQLLKQFGTGKDGPFAVADHAHQLSDDQLDLAASLLLGEAGCKLPVVYVSAGSDDRPSVYVDELAQWLGGLAHVVVEPTRSFSFKLMERTNGRNAYGGAIGVYWPASLGPTARFLGRWYRSSKEISQAVAEHVELSWRNRRPDPRTTWGYLRESTSRLALARLQAQGSTPVADYIEAFDSELNGKNRRLEEADAEIARLRAEVQRLESGPQHDGALLPGNEVDLYPGELSAILLDVLKDGIGRVQPDSRRYHVLDDLIRANDEDSAAADLGDRVKSVLRGYSSLGKKERKGLEELGFRLSEDGKHWKAVFRGDPRYTFALAKTPSDHRAGLNIASDIRKKLF